MSSVGSCVIIGASHAGVNLAFALRKEGFEGEVILIDRDPELPYHRPPLSKSFLSEGQSISEHSIKSLESYHKVGIKLLLGVEVTAVDREKQVVQLGTTEQISWGTLTFATGGKPFKPPIKGLDGLQKVFYLRDVRDAIQIMDFVSAIDNGQVVVIGGGYIGLEIAASLRKIGHNVVVLEREDRLLTRVSAVETSEYFRDLHERNGVRVEVGKNVESVTSDLEVRCSDGSVYAAHCVVVGVGIRVNSELAEDAGLEVENGIMVNEYLRTSDDHIYAIGDCANHIHDRYGRRLRIESVQNAVDQAKVAAANICGKTITYDSLPWFWSDQFDVKLQIVGLSEGYESVVVREDGESFSVWYFDGDKLLAVDAMNDGKAYVLGMKALKGDLTVDRAILTDVTLALHPKTLFI